MSGGRGDAKRGRLRRHAGGVALTLAFIPVGWLSSAAVFGADAPVRTTVLNTEPAPPPTAFDLRQVRAPLGPHESVSARIPGGRVRVYEKRSRKSKSEVLEARRNEGRKLPLVLLVRKRGTRWLKVDLPTRPNQSSGWIRTKRAKLRSNPYRVRVDLTEHRLTVFRGARAIVKRRIGVGRALSPTPTGRYYITDLIKAEDPTQVYGPYAFGLSGHSPVYTTFGSGDGQIGLHGTNDPSGLGSDVSSGCIRIGNRIITKLAKRLPLGTPVLIRRGEPEVKKAKKAKKDRRPARSGRS